MNSMERFLKPSRNLEQSKKHNLKKYDSLMNLLRPPPALAASFQNILTNKDMTSLNSSLDQLKIAENTRSKKEGRLYSHLTQTQTGSKSSISKHKVTFQGKRKSSLASLRLSQSIRSRADLRNNDQSRDNSQEPDADDETQNHGMLMASIDEVQIMPNI